MNCGRTNSDIINKSFGTHGTFEFDLIRCLLQNLQQMRKMLAKHSSAELPYIKKDTTFFPFSEHILLH